MTGRKQPECSSWPSMIAGLARAERQGDMADFLESIRSGRSIDNTASAAQRNLTAILGRKGGATPGRTPWSAAGPLAGLSAGRPTRASAADQGVRPTYPKRTVGWDEMLRSGEKFDTGIQE
jgi:hypothetical protein